MRRLVNRIKRVSAEMGYAQRRLLEIRTGVSFGAREDSGPPRGLAS